MESVINWDALGAIADLIAAVAVVVSLIYLAVQVSQNTRTLKHQGLESARYRYLGHFDRATMTQADAEIFRDGLNDFEKLSPSEQGCFHSKIHPLVHSFHHAWDLHRAGLIGDAEFSAMRDHTTSFLMTPGAQQWWAMHKTVPPPEIVNFLDEAVANASGNIEPATERFSWLRSD